MAARITIDGRLLELDTTPTILDAMERADVRLPQLCHDARVAPAGACRLCLVEVTGVARPVPACTTSIWDGMEVSTRTRALETGRREMIEAADRGDLKGMWAIGYDVLLTNPEAERTRRALGNLELLVIQDLFLNETARAHGTVFLPVCSSFEKNGTFMNAERRIQRVRAAIAPRGEARPDWQGVCQIAAAMGHAHQFGFESANEIWEEVRKVWPVGLGITDERIERGGLQWPCPDEHHPGTTRLHATSFASAHTARLHAAEYRPSTEVTDVEYPFALTTRGPRSPRFAYPGEAR